MIAKSVLKNRKFIPLLFCVLFLIQTQQLAAQNKNASALMDSVTITTLRTNNEAFKIPYSVSSVGESHFNKINARTTPELLAAVNGLFIQKTNHGGGSPFIRGLTGNQTLVLVDGIRLNNSIFRYGPNQYINTVDPFTIENIEVLKGTGSVQYGTDAIGGIINILSKKPELSKGKNSTTGNALARYVSGNMEKTMRLSGTYSTKRSAFQGGISLRNFGDLIGGKTTKIQSPSGYNEVAFDGKAIFALSDKINLQLAHQQVIQNDVPVYHKVVLENFAINKTDRQKRLLEYAKLAIATKNNLFKHIDITMSHQHGAENRTSLKNGSNTQVQEEDKITTAGFTVNVLSQIKQHYSVNTGVEYYHDWVKSERADVNRTTGTVLTKRGLYPNNSRYSNLSLYHMHNVELSKFVLNGGVRLNSFAITVKDTFAEQVRITPSAIVVNGAVMFSITNRHKLYANYSTGFRAPNIDDLGTLGIVDFRYELPTNNLAPEKSANYEVGYKYKSNKTKIDLAFYYMDLSNIITRNKIPNEFINGYQVYKKQNAERAYIKGFEAEVQQAINSYFKVSTAVSYTYGKNNSKQEPLRRIPPFNGRVITSYTKNNFFVNAEYFFADKQSRLAQGDKDDNRITKSGTASWHVVNIFTGYNFSFLQLNMGLQNITNTDYRIHGSGINAVGRSFVVSAAVSF